MIRTLSLILFVLSSGVLFATEEVVSVRADGKPLTAAEGVFNASAGSLIEIDATPLGEGSFRWLLANSEQFYLEVEGQRKVVFTSATPQQLIFILGFVRPGADPSMGKHELQKIIVQIGPSPNPDPNPNPNPRPIDPTACDDKPVGRFGLPRLTCQMVRQHVSVTPASQLEAQKLKVKDAILQLRTDFVGGSVSSGEIRNLLPIRVRTELGTDAGAWEAFSSAIATEIKRLSDAGQVVTDSDFRVLLSEINQGL